MKTSTEIASIAHITGEEKAIEYCAKAGFDAWDFSMFAMCRYDWATGNAAPGDHPLAGGDYAAFAKRLRQVGEDNGIHCNQSHAPFPTYVKPIRDMLKRAIECTAIAGGSICVIHPGNDDSVQANADMYLELLPFARAHNVKIATENMWDWDDAKGHSSFAACATSESFLEHMEAVNDPFFVACLDLGHAEMKGSGSGAPHMIRALGHHLQALHIHDNDLLNDSHQLPFTMQMDFDAIVKALQDIRYQGYFTLEADQYLHDRDESNVYAGVVEMAAAARKLADMFENK
ncbi:MAG: sugar phosphate isomerase/epimerase [Clostridiales bacterium]|nr:sugar phosphate isomerase/epimerase [Clostridiales bacterium]